MSITKLLQGLNEGRKFAIKQLAKKEASKLKKNPQTLSESAAKSKHHHAATVKALTRQQDKVRQEAKKQGMNLKTFKEKFSSNPSVKKLNELFKQNETVKNKQFKKGGKISLPRGCGKALRGYGKAMK
tara:strand:+ start:5890 stop:6273 length:384 start_codon:yes stop_codon:yes gene_type:complete